MSADTVAEQVVGELSPYLGPFNAKVAVRTFSQRALNRAPESLTLDHLSELLEALRPMLNTFVGRISTESLIDAIRRRVK